MAMRVLRLLLVLLLVGGGRAEAYLDPPTDRVVIHLLSAIFIVGSAAFIVLKNACVRLGKGVLRLLRRLGDLVKRRYADR